VKNEDLALFPGMTADAHIITAERSNVLRVPLPATRFNPEGLNRAPRAAGQNGQAREGGQPREGGASRASAENQRAPGEERHGPGSATGSGAGGGGAGNRRSGAANGRAQIWLLRDDKLVPVRVHTGLDDGTLIEVSGEDLKVGDVVVVNAVRPEAPPAGSPADNRPPGTNPNVRGGGLRQ